MEQQSISISKAGIVTSLQARCSVIAAANPIGGRYDPSKTFSENVQLTDPILTRFDVLCVLRDEVDPVQDERLAKFVLQSHFRSHPAEKERQAILKAKKAEPEQNAAAAGGLDGGSGSGTGGGVGGGAAASAAAAAASAPSLTEDTSFLAPLSDSTGDDGILPIPQDTLKKYIVFARDLRPVLTSIDEEKVVRLYADLRKESEISNGVPIAVRHIESIMRMSEALSRMHLSSQVSDSDLNMAIKVMLDSFIAAQKHATQKPLRRQFARYLQIDQNYNTLLLVKLRELVQERVGVNSVFGRSAGADVEIRLQDLADRARRHGITDLSSFLSNDLRRSGFVYDAAKKVIVWSGSV